MAYLPQPQLTETLVLADEVPISVHSWQITPPRGVIVFLHGLAEHARRYAEFAGLMAEQGWRVVMPDLRGHGLTAGDRLGIAGTDGWHGMVRDVLALIKRLRADHPNAPIVLGGYSMGSMLAQRVAQIAGSELAGLFLIGTGMARGGYDGLIMAMREAESLGRDAPSEITYYLFRTYCNRPFEPTTTPFDWLTSDAEQAAAYTNDPHCGILTSCGLYVDYQSALALTMTPANYALIPPALPILIQNGVEDMSSTVESVQGLIGRLAEIGARHVTWRLYAGLRHDLIHETRRDEVVGEISAWVERIAAKL